MTRVIALLTLALLGVASAQDYADVLGKSILFYEAQRSGNINDDIIPWRHASHTGDEVVGGWYDAGDHVKFGFPMAYSTTVLSWGAITFFDGYESAGETQNMVRMLSWATDYFVACDMSDKFFGQGGNGGEDHSYWGRPEDMPDNRPGYSVNKGQGASDLLGETAAALAAASMFYELAGESGKASEALSHARTLFEDADANKGVYTDAIPDAGGYYNSWSGYTDELVWAAVWMYKATGEDSYLSKAEDYYNQYISQAGDIREFSWDNKWAGAQVLLYEATGDSKYQSDSEAFINWMLNSAPYTPGGMIFIQQWGPARHAAAVAHLCAQAGAVGIKTSECQTFTEGQLAYILGSNPSGYSFVIGYGSTYPQRPHHRSSSCPTTGPCSWDQFNSPDPNPQTLNGALVGGPNQQDGYQDNRDDYVSNEVACDYNAGLQGAVASMLA